MASKGIAATLQNGLPVDFSRSQCSGNFQNFKFDHKIGRRWGKLMMGTIRFWRSFS